MSDEKTKEQRAYEAGFAWAQEIMSTHANAFADAVTQFDPCAKRTANYLSDWLRTQNPGEYGDD